MASDSRTVGHSANRRKSSRVATGDALLVKLLIWYVFIYCVKVALFFCSWQWITKLSKDEFGLSDCQDSGIVLVSGFFE